MHTRYVAHTYILTTTQHTAHVHIYVQRHNNLNRCVRGYWRYFPPWLQPFIMYIQHPYIYTYILTTTQQPKLVCARLLEMLPPVVAAYYHVHTAPIHIYLQQHNNLDRCVRGYWRCLPPWLQPFITYIQHTYIYILATTQQPKQVCARLLEMLPPVAAVYYVHDMFDTQVPLFSVGIRRQVCVLGLIEALCLYETVLSRQPAHTQTHTNTHTLTHTRTHTHTHSHKFTTVTMSLHAAARCHCPARGQNP